MISSGEPGAARATEPLRVVVGSKNPVKRLAVEGAFARAFPALTTDCVGISVASGVSDQPMTSEETYEGALGRARATREASPESHFWIGLEGGVEECNLGGGSVGLGSFAWACVASAHQKGQARSATFFLPPAVEMLVREGVELGVADDRVFGRTDSKRQEGAVGLLTEGLIDRRALYQQAMVLALIPFLAPWKAASGSKFSAETGSSKGGS